MNHWTRIGSLLAGLAVVLGAFAAHGLDRFCAEKYAADEPATVAGMTVPMSWKRLQDFRTGAEYQMYHALGMIAVGLAGGPRRSRTLAAAAWLFVAGIVLFSGSLYAITLTGTRVFGAIAPLGGTAFILGWIALACGAGYRTAASLEDESQAGRL